MKNSNKQSDLRFGLPSLEQGRYRFHNSRTVLCELLTIYVRVLITVLNHKGFSDVRGFPMCTLGVSLPCLWNKHTYCSCNSLPDKGGSNSVTISCHF